jgi:hypothetical protein
MTLDELKKKSLALIEEVNPNSKDLTDDPDIAAKFNDVTNQIMYELARMKKIPKYVEMEVSEGDLIDFAAIEKKCGYEVYQISIVNGVRCVPKASGAIWKVLESGTAEIDIFVYPERITADTNGSYEFELSADVLEIMPYGIAGVLLKSDVSAEYGNIYSVRYESMLQRLDPRYALATYTIEGGISV